MSKKPAAHVNYRSKSGRYWRWEAIICRSRATPGTWWLVAASAPATVLTQVRYRRHPVLRTPDGRLEAEGSNWHDVDGSRHCDFYVRWIPSEEMETAP